VPGAEPSPADRRRLLGFLDELHTWNERLNLTAVPPSDAWERHVAESVLLLERARIPPGARCVDIGSGGGVPGAVIAVLRPDLAVALVEADRRKAGFLVHVSGLLGLVNVTVLCRRAEELGHDPAHRERYDVAVSRAAAPPPLLCELALPLLRVGGSLWALVGDAGAAASSAATAAQACGGDVRADAPGVMSAHKTAPTPATMPRRRPRADHRRSGSSRP
jgi:16S rRNA (guanine527-N7)-methyltransferase